ncbi:MAG: hypothetical protein QNK23_14770 [Crocinitomicaceae bacterium]|nr:hypothetical protein [Crocinitomicaceae bacterium]
MRNLKYIYLLLVIVFSVSTGCSIESAHPPSHQELIIASNFLTEADSLMFEEFETEENVDITLIILSTEELMTRLKDLNSSANIDLVLMRSLQDVNNLSKEGLLHSFNVETFLPEEIVPYTSMRYHFVGVGIDPYIISYPKDSIISVKTYNDLTRMPYNNCVSPEDYPVLLAPALDKLKKVEANNWIKQFIEQASPCKSPSDSLAHLPMLSTYSSFQMQNDPSLGFIFPSTNSTGSFYDLRTASIVNQASNFVVAKVFILHLSQPDINQELNQQWNTISAFDNNSGFRKYQAKSSQLIPYYATVERVLSKL